MAVVAPFMAAYAYTHLARAVVPEPKLGGADYEDVKFETSDGLELEGWYIPSKNGAAVIAFPGRSGPQARALPRTPRLRRAAVRPARRGGERGRPQRVRLGGTKDLDAAIAFLRTRPDVDPERIGGIGLSVGGEMLLESAADTDALKAVVSEGAGIRSVKEGLELNGTEKWGQLPTWAATTLGTMVFAGRGPPENLKELAPRIAPTPVFFIYAERGQGGEKLSAEFYEVAGRPKRLWETDSGHTGGYDAAPVEYERRVVRFFDNALD